MFFQFSTDRIIQDFRARSQLLVSQHEDEDEVVCTLSDTSESEDEGGDAQSRFGIVFQVLSSESVHTRLC